MNEKTKSHLTGIVFFWAAAIIPFLGILIIRNLLGAYWFVTSLLIYAIIYRPILNIVRLRQLKLIEEKDFWKSFIPFHDAKYIKNLWLG